MGSACECWFRMLDRCTQNAGLIAAKNLRISYTGLQLQDVMRKPFPGMLQSCNNPARPFSVGSLPNSGPAWVVLADYGLRNTASR